jgi:hypothetical protein
MNVKRRLELNGGLKAQEGHPLKTKAHPCHAQNLIFERLVC